MDIVISELHKMHTFTLEQRMEIIEQIITQGVDKNQFCDLPISSNQLESEKVIPGRKRPKFKNDSSNHYKIISVIVCMLIGLCTWGQARTTENVPIGEIVNATKTGAKRGVKLGDGTWVKAEVMTLGDGEASPTHGVYGGYSLGGIFNGSTSSLITASPGTTLPSFDGNKNPTNFTVLNAQSSTVTYGDASNYRHAVGFHVWTDKPIRVEQLLLIDADGSTASANKEWFAAIAFNGTTVKRPTYKLKSSGSVLEVINITSLASTWSDSIKKKLGITSGGSILKKAEVVRNTLALDSYGDPDFLETQAVADFGDEKVDHYFVFWGIRDNTSGSQNSGLSPLLFTYDLDFGDAPNTYGTTINQNGPAHILPPIDEDFLIMLGDTATAEVNGIPSATAVGDADDGVVTIDSIGVNATGSTTIVPSYTLRTNYTNETGKSANFAAWIDWNCDSVFDKSEICTAARPGFPSTTGTVAFTWMDKTVDRRAAMLAGTFVRIRVTTQSIDSNDFKNSSFADGEVEDYRIPFGSVKYDFGDAPNTFGTSTASNGPKHIIANSPLLLFGTGTTSEADGIGGILSNSDTDDGVITLDTLKMPAAATTTTISSYSVRANYTNNTGKIATHIAWIDWNNDNIFDASEGVSSTTTAAATSGIVTFTWTGKTLSRASVADTVTYVRIRNSTGALTTSLFNNSTFQDGEVEDYMIKLSSNGGFDFGDAPNSYGTTAAANGPRHTVLATPVLTLGSGVTTDADGNPSILANGDIDDGVATIDTIFRGTTPLDTINYSLNVNFNNITGSTAYYAAWVDWNNNGTFEAAEGIINTSAAISGIMNFSWTSEILSNHLSKTETYVRIRTSTTPITTTDALLTAFADGEVEDYLIPFTTPIVYDFGDAPNTYGTSIATNGPSHIVSNPATLTLGASITTEANGTGSSLANSDSDDGVTKVNNINIDSTATSAVIPSYTLTTNFVNNTGKVAQFVAWIDWNNNGTFEASEGIRDTTAATTAFGSVSFTWIGQTVSRSAITDTLTFARIRVTTDSIATTDYNSTSFSDGEVEDYVVIQKELIAYDYGDAPARYGVFFAKGLRFPGPRNRVPTIPLLTLGADVTTENDGAAGAFARKDEDDAIDIVYPIFWKTDPVDTITYSLTVTYNNITGNTAQYVAWIDWNNNGEFESAEGETATTPGSSTSGTLTFTWTNELLSNHNTLAHTFARIMTSTATITTADAFGLSLPDGEVEDYLIPLSSSYDYGDAPNTYGTDAASNGPRHGLQTVSLLNLGLNVTADVDGIGGVMADADTDDGVYSIYSLSIFKTDTTSLIASYSLNVTCTNNTGVPAYIVAWIDWNNNGTFEASEGIKTTSTTAYDTVALNWTGRILSRASIADTTTYVRIRVTTDSTIDSTHFYNSLFQDGEVEDYLISYAEPVVTPINLISFDAISQNEKVKLKWEVGNQANVERYEIYKSTNGRDFTSIGFTKAIKNEQSYFLWDNNPNEGMNLYRLKNMDFNGLYQYSSTTLRVDFNRIKLKLFFYPNPTSGVININTTGYENLLTLKVYDATGKVQMQKVLIKGLNRIDIHNFNDGIYYFELFDNGNKLLSEKVSLCK